MSGKICIVVFSLTVLSVTISKSEAAVSDSLTEKPNVIFILADDSGFSDPGCYGSEIQTPNLDKLAANGLRFTQFYNTGRCWPTRASLMTGYYPHQVHRDKLPSLGGGGGNRGVRQKWARLLPDFLKPHGYRNYHSGKWHIDGPVLPTGFDRSLDIRNQGNFFSNKDNRIDDQPVAEVAADSGYYSTTATIDHAIGCLEEHSEKYSDRPFFHFVAFIAPHFPLHAPPEDIQRYADSYLNGWEAMRDERFAQQLRMGIHKTTLSKLETTVGPPYHFADAYEKLGSGEIGRPMPWAELTDEQRRFQATKMAIHAAMVDRMDQEIGRLLKHLKKMGQFENTVIFYGSDNGASAEIMVRNGGHDPTAAPGSEASYLCLGPGFSSACNTPFRRHKTWVHEGGIATPLIVHWPQGIKAKGELRHTPGHMIDILPTVLDLIGVEKPRTWKGEPIPAAPGKSLLAAFNDDIVIQRESLWWLHEGNRAVRVGDLKLVASDGEPWELYDMSNDRAESNNIVTSLPEKAKELEAIWNAQLKAHSQLAAKTMKDQPKRRRKNNRQNK
ncbi:MAG: arylsulfatase [Mariniblastus sp.]|nr:arylsulfatase [Mariniblastus sp.]